VLLDKYIPKDAPPPESLRTGRTNALHFAIQGGIEANVINILNHKKCPNLNARDSEGWNLCILSHDIVL